MTVTISGYQLLETLHTGSQTVIYRGRREIDNASVVIKAIASEYPSLEDIARLRHEYKILQSLQIPGVIKAYELKNYHHSLALVLENFSGFSLKEIINNGNTTLIEFLQIAIKVSQTLGELHAQNVIHKDIKPHNILINPESGEVKLIDFSISSRLDKENPTLSNPNLLEGTLAYMSPEQTGRMNRAIDYRTDFYSLGVTFYELLTGTLPFHAADPIELVHCHIAKTPVIPCQDTVCRVLVEVPEAITAIIFKLLAKTAEDRYQSAWGLKADLEECLRQLQATEKIEKFVPGRLDKSGQFLIPQKLYGRENEVAQILAAFERITATKNPKSQIEMVLVSGYSGIGKTSVVNEVHKPILGARGYFIAGKFDQFKRNIPYASLIQAFQSLIEQLLTESESQVRVWQEKLLDALGVNGQVIIDVIPEVELIIGSQPPMAQLGATESQNRFNRVFKQFIGVFTTPEHPLVIFLDDLQWADSASLHLIEMLMSDPDSKYLLLIGAYRDNEVSPTHPLMMSLEKIQSSGAAVNNILLAPLKLADVEALITETFNQVEMSVETQNLASLLFHKTGGNPFFLTQLLKTLYQEDLLIYNFSTEMWQWNIERIQAIGITDLTVVELVARNIRKLPEDTQKVLKLAACIGNTFSLDVLAIARGTDSTLNQESSLVTATQLWSALQAGLILPLNQGYKIPLVFSQEESGGINLTDLKVDYKFLHDRVQQAAYSLIPDDEKKATHLKIGRALLENTTPEEQKDNIFALVNQLNYGTDLLTSDSEKYQLAELNLLAGQKAKTATAYESAIKYLNVGLELLPTDSWKSHYKLTFNLYTELAEAEYLKTNFERAEILTEIILQATTDLLDKVKVYEIKMLSYIAQSQMLKAIDTGLSVLQMLGVSVSSDRQDNIAIKLPQIEELKDIPVMTDPYKLAAMKLLMNVCPAAYIAKPDLLPTAILTMVDLCIKHGNSGPSAFAYVYYGLLLVVGGNIEVGYDSGQLALRLLDQFEANSLKAKVYTMFYTVIQVWKDHLQETIAPLEKVVQIGLEIGDIEWVSYCALNYCSILFFKGEQLETVNKKVGQSVELMSQIKQDTAIYCTTLWKQIVLNLQGLSANKLDLGGESFNEAVMLPLLEESNNFLVLFYLYVGKGMLLYLFKDYEQSVKNFRLATKYIGAVPGMIVVAGHNFYYSLALLALAANNPETSSQQLYLSEATENQEKMQKWASHAPSNFQHKYELVEAEKARVLGQKEKATDSYERAITGAREQEYIQDEALANELAAEFHRSLNREKIAKTYMTDAYYGYIRWGAVAKVKDLESKCPELIMRSLHEATEKSGSFIETIHTRTTSATTTKAAYLLDLTTVHKASLVLSEEIMLNSLLEKMMRIVIENAGASQGYFITKQENEWFLEAFGTIKNQELNISTYLPFSDFKISSLMLPLSLLNYVERTKTNLLLDNAVKDPRFATEPYIHTNQPKAILCLPLIHSGKLTGILYLENNLIEGAFTSERVKVLNLLSSQISIAIDNARLYTNLQNYSQQLEQSLHRLQQTQSQLVQTEKISSLGQLVAGVAHEVNNPVSFINGNLHHTNQYVQDLIHHLELYQETFPNPPENIVENANDIDLEYLLEDLPKMVSSMQMGTERIKDIMLSLRNFSRTDTADKKPADIHAGIDSTVMILHHRLKATGEFKAINIVREYEDLPLVECYAGSLNQVFMNILANAIDAMEEERKISEKEIRIRTELIDDSEVVIRIKDNGAGMAEAVRERLFDAFFTTKPEGKGTGLGLSISYQIVTEKHGGKLTCTSSPGAGAEFAIAIPLH